MSNVVNLKANVSGLARAHNVSRRTIARWQKDGWSSSALPAPPVPPPSRGGLSIYFIRAGQDRVKIGSSRNVKARLSDLQAAHYEKLELLSVIPNVKQSLEFELHKKFEKDHIRGEWFKLSHELLAFIISAGLPPK